MTGHWRVSQTIPKSEKHDHVQLQFRNSSLYLTYNDPRRFGYLDFINSLDQLKKHKLFIHLGLEPLSEDFTAELLKKISQKSERAVKIFLMDQKNILGIGNIYASEILFQAKVKPQKKANQLKNETDKIETNANISEIITKKYKMNYAQVNIYIIDLLF